MTHAWHEEARRLIANGTPVAHAAKLIGKSPTAVRFALDINGEREKQRIQRRKKARYLQSTRPKLPSFKPATGRSIDRAVVTAYAKADAAGTKITLPFVSILQGDGEGYKLAPKGYFYEA